jgi:hypothetical protein
MNGYVYLLEVEGKKHTQLLFRTAGAAVEYCKDYQICCKILRIKFHVLDTDCFALDKGGEDFVFAKIEKKEVNGILLLSIEQDTPFNETGFRYGFTYNISDRFYPIVK